MLYFLPAAGSSISFLYFVTFLLWMGYFYGGLFNLVYSVIYLVPYIFYLLNQVKIGKLFLSLSFLVQVSVHSMVLFPKASYFQLYFL